MSSVISWMIAGCRGNSKLIHLHSHKSAHLIENCHFLNESWVQRKQQTYFLHSHKSALLIEPCHFLNENLVQMKQQTYRSTLSQISPPYCVESLPEWELGAEETANFSFYSKLANFNFFLHKTVTIFRTRSFQVKLYWHFYLLLKNTYIETKKSNNIFYLVRTQYGQWTQILYKCICTLTTQIYKCTNNNCIQHFWRKKILVQTMWLGNVNKLNTLLRLF